MCQYYLAKLQVYIDSYTSCNAHARMKSTHKKELRTYRLLLNNTPDWLQKRVIASNVNGKDFFISVFERSLSWKRNIIRFEWNFQFLFLVFSRTIGGHVFFFTPTKERLVLDNRGCWRTRTKIVFSDFSDVIVVPSSQKSVWRNMETVDQLLQGMHCYPGMSFIDECFPLFAAWTIFRLRWRHDFRSVLLQPSLSNANLKDNFALKQNSILWRTEKPTWLPWHHVKSKGWSDNSCTT